MLGLLGGVGGWRRRWGGCLRLGRGDGLLDSGFAGCLPLHACDVQGRFKDRVVFDKLKVDENLANDVVQLLKRVAGGLRAEAFAMCA